MTENNEDRHADHIDALNAMAGGGEINSQNPEPQDEQLDDAPVEEEVMDLPPDAVDIGVTVDPGQARRARQVGLQGRMQKAHAEQFKRTMIPLLLVVGAMLLLISLTTVLMMAMHNEENGEFMKGYGWPMTIGSFLLSAILMLGAWMFHNEVKKVDQR